ncbi:MAG TPA: IPT/TIG domain-containing protein [Thermoanaerobaculia bacterium]|jgi:hypothetical protein|nr:IPT/TIG domain-containing protein [Thermoanaerobaculia bacterium]
MKHLVRPFCLNSAPGRAARRTSPAALLLAFGLFVSFGASAQGAADALLPLTAAPVAGEQIESSSGSAAELFSFVDGLAPSLIAAPVERELEISAFPVAPGERADVVVARHEIYAPDAKIFALDRGVRTEVPRSRWIFFWGATAADPSTRVFLSVDPNQGKIRGFAAGPKGTWDFQPYEQAGEGQMLIAPPAFFQPGSKATEPTWVCGEDEGPGFLEFPPSGAAGGGGPSAITTLHSMTLAVDTDNEFMLSKACTATNPPVCNDATTANNYLASLIASMSAIYERDLLVRLLQGTTTLRFSSTPDPYAQNSGSSASPAELSEFSNYWSANFGGVTRGLAMMISGKSPSAFSASGIAWINGLCSTNTGYSFSKVFGPAQAISNDAKLVGHELGHNFGSPHTHCYSPPLDNCFNGEGGCYAGGTSCPAATTINGVTNVRGTIMSYCHLLGGCTSSAVFHPISVALIAPLIQSRVNICIFPGTSGGAGTVTGVWPRSGPVAGGTPVTITGSGFVTGAAVTFGGTSATSIVVVNPTTITAVTPAKSTGKVSVSVTNPGGSALTLADAFFYMPADAPRKFFTVSPCRVLDTRNAGSGGALAGSSTRVVQMTGICSVPSSAKAISANVSVVAAGGAGFFGAFPGNGFPTGTTIMSFRAGQTRTNNAVILLATDGAGTALFQNGATQAANLVVDVNGYFQ